MGVVATQEGEELFQSDIFHINYLAMLSPWLLAVNANEDMAKYIMPVGVRNVVTVLEKRVLAYTQNTLCKHERNINDLHLYGVVYVTE